MKELTGVLQSIGTLSGSLSVPEQGALPVYDGPYHVIPKAWQGQELETRQKMMEDNVTVDEVPYIEVSNPEGTTCIIATE